MRPLRIGVVGLGVGASAVFPTMEVMPEIELVAGADISPEVRTAFQARYPNTRVYATIRDLRADPNVEAVWVATPNRFHCAHAIEAMQNGKHVAVEKPMAVTLEEADLMVEAAERYEVKLLPAHTSSYQVAIRGREPVKCAG
jgi:phthalate 4,5-cis-dihydrodiol dehydrogenase